MQPPVWQQNVSTLSVKVWYLLYLCSQLPHLQGHHMFLALNGTCPVTTLTLLLKTSYCDLMPHTGHTSAYPSPLYHQGRVIMTVYMLLALANTVSKCIQHGCLVAGCTGAQSIGLVLLVMSLSWDNMHRDLPGWHHQWWPMQWCWTPWHQDQRKHIPLAWDTPALGCSPCGCCFWSSIYSTGTSCDVITHFGALKWTYQVWSPIFHIMT